MNSSEYWAEKTVPVGSSVYYAFLFLPPAQKTAATALYVLAGEAQDIVAKQQELSVAHAKLAWWRGEADRLGSGTSTHPVMSALEPYAADGTLAPSLIEQIFDGVEMDLAQTRYLDYRGLERYCTLISGTVAEALARILGATDTSTLQYARQLGVALELTEILRDVGEHARRGRIYLPLDELKRFGVSVPDILQAHGGTEFVALMRFQSDRVRALYRAADAALPSPHRLHQRPGLIMAAHAQALLTELERDQFPVLRERVALTPMRKLLIAWRVWLSRGRLR